MKCFRHTLQHESVFTVKDCVFLTSAEEEGIKIDLSHVQRLCKTIDAYSLLLSNGDTSSLDPGTINHCQGLPTQ